MTVFSNFGSQNKILSLGVDDASNNTICIDYIFESRCIDFLVKDFFHVRCVCHVLNLYVQDGIEMLSYIVNPVRNTIRWIHSPNKNRLSFKEACRNRSVPYKSFNLNMPIRWGSTYKLLRDTYIHREIISDLYNNAMGKDILTQDLVKIVEIVVGLSSYAPSHP